MLRQLTTLDVSRNGIFVVMDSPPSRGQLIHLTVLLPSGGAPLPLRGMALHVVTGAEAIEHRVPAGVGIQFYGIGKVARERWDSFFGDAWASHVAAGSVAHPPTPRGASEPSRARDTLRADRMQRVIAGARKKAEGEAPSDEASTEERPAVPADGPDSTEVVRASTYGDVVQGLGAASALAPTGAVRAPSGWAEPAHYRLCPPTVDAVLRFRQDALDSGGVVLVGTGSRPPGTPAVVSVVHPMTGAEFHVPGEIQPGGEDRGAAVVRFFAVTDRTKEEFEGFAEEGRTPAIKGSYPPSSEPELSIYWSAEEAQWDLVTDQGGTVVAEGVLPLEEAINPLVRKR